eukprot:2449866-Pyramimonas_sp.AAC.1
MGSAISCAASPRRSPRTQTPQSTFTSAFAKSSSDSGYSNRSATKAMGNFCLQVEAAALPVLGFSQNPKAAHTSVVTSEIWIGAKSRGWGSD